MIAGKGWRLLCFVGIVVGIPLAGRWLRPAADAGCALDGGKIISLYRVEIVADRTGMHAFCCLRCARIWLRRQPTVSF